MTWAQMFPDIAANYRQHLIERVVELSTRFRLSGYRDHEANRLLQLAYDQLHKAPK